MSRHTTSVPVSAAFSVFGEATDNMPFTISDTDVREIEVAHGYDNPCNSYFCDLLPDCEIGIWYGKIGMGKRLGRNEYLEAMQALGLKDAESAVALDIHY